MFEWLFLEFFNFLSFSIVAFLLCSRLYYVYVRKQRYIKFQT